ncbi:hypothetical protein Tco_1401311 [Tanacetum coccineum]
MPTANLQQLYFPGLQFDSQAFPIPCESNGAFFGSFQTGEHSSYNRMLPIRKLKGFAIDVMGSSFQVAFSFFLDDDEDRRMIDGGYDEEHEVVFQGRGGDDMNPLTWSIVNYDLLLLFIYKHPISVAICFNLLLSVWFISQSQKLASKNENKKAPTDVVKGSNIPNTDQFKTPKTISKLDSSRTIKPAHANKAHGKPSAESLLNQKSNKQQSTLSQSSVKNVQKSAPVKNSSQHIKSVLNKPETIFGGDSDESSADDNAAAKKPKKTKK